MKSRVYVETSVISYLAARPSADAIIATRQHFLYRLWQARTRLELLVSDAVLAEARIGDDDAVRQRLAYCKAMATVKMNPRVEEVAAHLIRCRAIPAKAYTDAVHIAIAALHQMDFIASWNFRHIVGALARRNIERALADMVQAVPIIATPEEILESVK